jgi:hypothetical protein
VTAARLGWTLATTGLALAVLASRTAVTTLDLPSGAGAATAVPGWAGGGASLLLLGLGVVALDGAGRLDRLARAGASRALRRVLVAGTALALLAPAGALAAGTARALDPADGLAPVAPAATTVALDAARSPDAVRTLVLSLAEDGSATAAVQRGGASLADASAVRAASRLEGPLGAPVLVAPDPAEQALRAAAAVLIAGGTDPRARLADLGVGYVLAVPPGGAPTDGSSPLDAVPGLARAGATPEGVLHRVVPPSGGGAAAPDRPARARLLDSGGAVLAALPSEGLEVTADLPAALGERTVVLAERAEDGWRATLDGRSLRRVQHAGWALAFEVPAEGGHLEVHRSDPEASAWTALQGVVLLLTVLLAVPVPGVRRVAW